MFKTNVKDDSKSWWNNVKDWFGGKSKEGTSFSADVKANVTEYSEKLKNKSIDFTANLTGRNFSNSFSKSIDVTANFNKRDISKLNTTINVTGNFTAIKGGNFKMTPMTAATGGVITSHGVVPFSSGGSIAGRDIRFYAGGTSDAHGTMFVAGEAGPEIVGHIGGRTEVLNQSQLAQTMLRSVAAGMSQYTVFFNTVSKQLVAINNNAVNAVFRAADAVCDSIKSPNAYAYTGIVQSVTNGGQQYRDDYSEKNENIRSAVYSAMRDFYAEMVAPTVIGMAEDMRRQADKPEGTTVKIGGKTISEAVDVQTRADGYRFTR